MTELPFAYKGEAQLVRWSETPKGRTVTLLLDPFVGEQHPFKALKCGENGQRMQLAAVLVGDDDQPVPPKRNGRVAQSDEQRSSSAPDAGSSPAAPTTARTYTRSQRAAIMCQDLQFRVWFCDLLPTCFSVDGESDVDNCDKALKEFFGITSKSELDTDPEAAARFDALRTDFELRDLVR